MGRLQESTGNPRADAVLHSVVTAFEDGFPGRTRGYYLHGSQADGTSVDTSDLDLDVIVKDALRDQQERTEMARLAEYVARRSDLELDVEVADEASLALGAEPAFKLGSRLVYGEDIRSKIPLVPVQDWARERMHRGYFLLVKVFGRPPHVRYPIGFPDPKAEFFGYTAHSVGQHDGRCAPSTRNIVRVTGWLATALLAHEAGQYVARKGDCYRLYREYVGDEWTSLLEDTFVLCRSAWRYMVPGAAADRRRLRALCTRVLAFENHFLSRYKPFLLAELNRSQTETENRAVWLMKQILFEDDDVQETLRSAIPIPGPYPGRLR
jgi:hypothetical protein